MIYTNAKYSHRLVLINILMLVNSKYLLERERERERERDAGFIARIFLRAKFTELFSYILKNTCYYLSVFYSIICLVSYCRIGSYVLSICNVQDIRLYCIK